MINWVEESSFARGIYEEALQKNYRKAFEEGYRKGFQEGYRRGLRKGRVKALRQLVPLLQDYGVSLEQVLAVVGMTRKEFEATELDED